MAKSIGKYLYIVTIFTVILQFSGLMKTNEAKAASLTLNPVYYSVADLFSEWENSDEIGESELASELTIQEEKTEYTVQEVLLAVCEYRGYGEECAKDLLGMLWTESSNRSTVIGDYGRARGYYQIHYKLHNIPIECAEDIVCSSMWTIDYLERNQYVNYSSYAIQCHNGCYARNGYVSKVNRYAEQFWDKPLTITQATPVVLPEVEMII